MIDGTAKGSDWTDEKQAGSGDTAEKPEENENPAKGGQSSDSDIDFDGYKSL